jgi:hypothetical protein
MFSKSRYPHTRLYDATEQVDLAVTLYTCILEVLGLNVSRVTGMLTEIYRGFPQFFQAHAGLGYDRFLPNHHVKCYIVIYLLFLNRDKR